jgi:uncharacterized protein
MDIRTPVENNQREIFMDVLRGIAILGIFIANLNAFTWYNNAAPPAEGAMIVPGWDGKLLFLHHMFIEGKFYSIFSFLFGWGMALQIMRAESKGLDAASLIRRRLAVMLILGAVHLMLWPGDIVFLYALMGFIILPLRRFSNKTLIIASVLLFLSPIALYALKMKFPVLNTPSSFLFETGRRIEIKLFGDLDEDAFYAYFKNAGWYDIFKGNLAGFFYRYGDLFFQSRIPKVLSVMLLGMVVGRTGFFQQIGQYKKLVYSVIAIGLIVGLPANYILARYMSLHDGSYYSYKTNGLYRTVAYALGVVPLALAYVSLLMLSFQSVPCKKFLRVLAPVGKMAFTNYITQTLIGNFVFLGAGLGYMEKVGPVYYTLFALLVFTFQVIGSTIWLRYFHYGPIEWLWRSGTYGKWQPFRIRRQ